MDFENSKKKRNLLATTANFNEKKMVDKSYQE